MNYFLNHLQEINKVSITEHPIHTNKKVFSSIYYIKNILSQINFALPQMKTDLIPAYLPVYIFNVLHIGSMVGLSFKVVNDYMRNTIFIEYDMVFLLMTLISMGSGYMMTFLFQTSQMGANKNLWISWHNLKLLVTLILFLPVYKFLPVLNTGIVTARFIWFVALIFLSPMAKFYREHYSRFAELKTQ